MQTTVAGPVRLAVPELLSADEIPRNPRAAHSIYDEVRRVGEGLYLGRGMRRRAGGPPRLVLWFGLDTRIADRPVAFRDVG